jgi:hypothetical protein
MNFKDYIKGQRQGKDANRFEQEAQNDPFLMEAIDGFDEHPSEMHLSVIEELEENVLRHSSVKKTSSRRIWYIGVAASLALLVGISFFFQPQKPDEIILAKNTVSQESTEEETEKEDTSAFNIEGKLIAQQQAKSVQAPTAQMEIVEDRTFKDETARQVVELEAPVMIAEDYVFVEADVVARDYIDSFASLAEAEVKVADLYYDSSLAKIDVTDKQYEKSSTKILGKVVDEHGEPIIGASVLEKGTNNGTVTDIDGNFALAVNDAKNAEIQAAFIGYNTKTVAANKSSVIKMDENQMALSEVVVTGYGKSRRKDVTGSVSKVSATEFNKDKFLSYFNANRRDIECKEENPNLKAEFFIDKNGNPSKIKIIECNCKKLEDEFRRMLQSTQNWTITDEKISIEIGI